ncbi:CNNM domain-containing protein [Mesomycoplasma neurolyticum]|uniref:Mg2+ and Co2+ transporter CorB n=1 Tax=Mesomycoplasma neurolyticum TaxID=2120 RepID=A0A449A668_9BACT|nr:CNNM domain-containing protein [Mesomycoplasma neurolyticum]VEU59780.1 Putative Mg2+ and Co2+ transporter CorB [Mesomycoplasma neurolyticum]
MQDLKLIILSLLIFILVIISSLSSASETSFLSINTAKLEDYFKDKHQFVKKKILKLHKKFSGTLSTILLINNIVNIAASATMSAIVSSLSLNNNWEIIISTAIMTPIIVLIGEIIPKIIARKFPITFLKNTWWIIYFFYYLFWPITFLISKISKENPITNTESELKYIIDIAGKEGVLEKEESLLTKRALDFDSIKVHKHYTRLRKTTSIKYESTLEEIRNIFYDTGFSRLPVEKNKKFIGIILLKDIFYLKNEEDFEIDKFIVKVPNISSNTLLKNALYKLKENQSHFAFITKNNEDKTIIGIITIEDIIEELVGEIYDEHDFRDENEIYIINANKIIVHYSTKIDKINKILEVDIPLEEETIGKYLETLTTKKMNLKFKHKENNLYYKVIENKKNKEIKFEVLLEN